MAKKFLDLAQELRTSAEALKEVAEKAGVRVQVITQPLTEEEEARVRAAFAASGGGRGGAGGRRITRRTTTVGGDARARDAGGAAKSVEIVTKRRRRRAAKPAAEAAAKKAAPQAPAAAPAASGAVKAEAGGAGKAAAQASASAPPRQTRSPQAASAAQAPKRAARARGPAKTLRPAEIARQRTQQHMSERSRQAAEARRRQERPAGARAGAGSRPGGSRGPGARPAPLRVAVAPEGPSRPQRRKEPRKAASRAEKVARREYLEKKTAVLTEEEEERLARLAKGPRRKRRRDEEEARPQVVREVEITDPILVSDLAQRMAVKVGEVLRKLVEMGAMLRANDPIDADTAVLLVEEFGHRPKVVNEAAVEDVLAEEPEDDPDKLQPRPPVVVVVGHVDHGKTTLLDALRRTDVAAREAGGITQHIGAYMVKLESGARVVFIDTPGHEAFTTLRARGAKVADVAVLVVAADDGVKPQTIEAISHARAADTPIIVAVNKVDKPEANPEMVRRQLSEQGLVPEEWGGDTIFVDVSAKTGKGLDELLEMLALQTELLELRANPERRGRGVVIESRLDRGRGPVATVLTRNGTFRQGDIVVCGTTMGRIRAIVDENGVQHRTAGPSVPFELLGLEEVPEAGEEVVVVDNERQARDIVEYRRRKQRERELAAQKKLSLEELFAQVQSGVAEVPVIIKGDVAGSVEALVDAFTKLSTDEVRVRVIHKGVGRITESDITLAAASNAIVIGFNVRPESKAKKLAEEEGVDVRFYRVIYDAVDDMKAALAGRLAPEKVEKVLGQAEVRQVFRVPKLGAVAGCYVQDGVARRNAHVRVLRDGKVVYEGRVASLRRFKEDVPEVRAGFECGVGVENFNDLKEGDVLEFFVVEEIAPTLD